MVVWILFHVSLPPPLHRAGHLLLIWRGGGGRCVNRRAMSKTENIEDGVSMLALNGAEGRRTVQGSRCSRTQRPKDVLVRLTRGLGKFCSLFHLGFPGRLRGTGVGVGGPLPELFASSSVYEPGLVCASTSDPLCSVLLFLLASCPWSRPAS